MLSDRLRNRLEALNRAPIPDAPKSRPELRVVFGDSPAQDATQRSLNPTNAPARDATEGLPGCVCETVWGSHWLVQQPMEVLWPAYSRHWPPVKMSSHDSSHGDVVAMQAAFPERAVFLDLETCGFAGTAIFLAGLLHWLDGKLVLSQLWARSYAEEKAMLQSLWSLMAGQQLLVTFNGKSFDWPQVHDRSTLHHLGLRRLEEDPVCDIDEPSAVALDRLEPTHVRPEPRHVDLLHHARRRWRHQLPNCRLQTLERYICGRRRVGDLPGSEIPDAYHDYVRSGRNQQVKSILHHNALDLVTLLQLAIVFMSHEA